MTSNGAAKSEEGIVFLTLEGRGGLNLLGRSSFHALDEALEHASALYLVHRDRGIADIESV